MADGTVITNTSAAEAAAAAAAAASRDATLSVTPPNGVRDSKPQADDPAKAGDGTNVPKPQTDAEKAAAAAAAAAKTPEQIAADTKTEADKVAADKVIADKAAADKVVADAAALTAAEKAVTDAKTPEEKTAAEKALADLKKAQGKEEPKAGAPEKYEAFKVPEGTTIDPVQLTEFEGLSKAMNLSQADAQKLIDFEAKRMAAGAAAQQEAWGKTIDDWGTAARADKEIGGAKFDENLAHAKRFLKAFGTPALTAMLDATGTGSNVEFLRAFAKAGKEIGEDTLHFGGTQQKPAAEPFYNHPTSKHT